MYIAVNMGVPEFLSVYLVQPVLFGYAFHYVVVEPLQRKAHISVLIYSPVLKVNVFVYHALCIHEQILYVPEFLLFSPVQYVCLGDLGVTLFNKNPLDYILYVFHRGYPGTMGFIDDVGDYRCQPFRLFPVVSAHRPNCGKYCVFNLCDVEAYYFSVAFLYFLYH